MKKTHKILLIILVILIIGGIVFLSISINNKEKGEGNNKADTPIEKVEYYRNIHKKMYDYYLIMYKNMNVPEDKKDSTIRINLGTLKREGFPMDEFVSFDGKNECDMALSYATRKVVDNKYKIEVFYKCGGDANYDLTKNTTTKKVESDETTTKKASSTKEEAEQNKNKIRENRTTRKVNN